METSPKKEQLKSGYFFSPGYYMDYWRTVILPNFSPKEVAFHVKLKPHREVWLGAHLAALKTILSGQEYFVALPDNDPPDVLVGTFDKTTVKSGRIGRNLNWYPVEITRCDESSRETLFGQIEKKNKSAYSNMVLAIYLQGANKIPDLNLLSKTLDSLEVFYPREVIIMAELESKKNNVTKGTFAFAQVYPNYESVIVDRSEPKAYFMEPNIMRVTGLGVQSSSVKMGQIELMPPII